VIVSVSFTNVSLSVSGLAGFPAAQPAIRAFALLSIGWVAKRQLPDSVGLHALAALVPILRLHDVVGHAHLRELAVKVETEGSGLTGAPAPALRAAFEAVYLAPLDS
jgi:hypothetical protein